MTGELAPRARTGQRPSWGPNAGRLAPDSVPDHVTTRPAGRGHRRGPSPGCWCICGLWSSVGWSAWLQPSPRRGISLPGASHSFLSSSKRAAALRSARPPRPPRRPPQRSLSLSQGNRAPAALSPLTSSRCPGPAAECYHVHMCLRASSKPPRATLGNSWLRLSQTCQVLVLGPAPTAPSQAHETSGARGSLPAAPVTGAWRRLAPPAMVPAGGSDDTAFELSQHHLPGVLLPAQGLCMLSCPCP